MKLHRELGISQKSAWFMLHRLRKPPQGAETGVGPFAGPIEVDETYMGGKRKNMSTKRRKKLTGRGPVGKTAVVGAKDRATKQVSAKAVTSTDKETSDFPFFVTFECQFLEGPDGLSGAGPGRIS